MTNPRGFRIYPFTTKRIGGVEQMKRAGMWPDGDGLYRQVRVRGRIEAVLDWPPSVAYRAGDNPARWRGHLAKLLPALNMSRVKHHAALHFNQVGKFQLELRQANFSWSYLPKRQIDSCPKSTRFFVDCMLESEGQFFTL